MYIKVGMKSIKELQVTCFKACQHQGDPMLSCSTPNFPHSGALLTNQALSAYSCHAQSNSTT